MAIAIFGTYLRAGRGSEPVWFRGPKTSPKVPVIYGATSGGPNPKLMMTLKKACPPLILGWGLNLDTNQRRQAVRCAIILPQSILL